MSTPYNFGLCPGVMCDCCHDTVASFHGFGHDHCWVCYSRWINNNLYTVAVTSPANKQMDNIGQLELHF